MPDLRVAKLTDVTLIEQATRGGDADSGRGPGAGEAGARCAERARVEKLWGRLHVGEVS